ncbi:protein of unknown function [Methylocella tundrae]|uniref:Uncharacterized protein n=1 Tax=Methylocella tundrae TaxID=227605 RepID=A0A4V6YUK1_METTU|nr:protein of unknown function [Methylocella tundrae]
MFLQRKDAAFKITTGESRLALMPDSPFDLSSILRGETPKTQPERENYNYRLFFYL